MDRCLRVVLCVVMGLALVSGCAADRREAPRVGASGAGARGEIDRVLDDWHGAATSADYERYFGHMAPDGVFMGTDAAERWSVAEFQAYARPRFESGKAWSFTAHDRHVEFSETGEAAWFDEALATPHLGACRGSGVMTRRGSEWKISHYNLSIPIPNDLASNVVRQIEEHGVKRRGGSAELPVMLMTFNIRYNNAGDAENAWPNRRGMVSGVIERHAPDVVGVQEALHAQLQELLADVPGYASVGVGRDDGAERGEYAPILYRADRLAVLESGNFWFSETPAVPGSKHWGNSITRMCTWARFEDNARPGLSGERAFYVYNVHLDHQSQASRERSVRLLVERISRREHQDPVFVTGDFNAGEANAAVLYMKGTGRGEAEGSLAVFVDSFRQEHPDEKGVGTFNAFKGSVEGDKIDYIFVSPGTAVREAGILRDSIEGRFASDHFPVVARVWFRR